MNKYLLILCVFAISCDDPHGDKTNNENNNNNTLNLSAEFCEAIKDADDCNNSGCRSISNSFDFVDSEGNCIKKLYRGNICIYAEIQNSNNGEPSLYYKNLGNGITVGMNLGGLAWLDGWTENAAIGYMDYCCHRDPSSCQEPYEDISGQWYPFEGLLD